MKYFLLLVCLVFSLYEAEGCDHLTTPKLIWYGNKGYHFGTYSRMNWFKAYEYCSYLGMQLLTLNSMDELKFLIKTIKDSGYDKLAYWTSGNDLGEEGNYIWMSTGTTWTKNLSALWGPGQPDNWKNSEHCIDIYVEGGFMLNDRECHFDFYPLCETKDC